MDEWIDAGTAAERLGVKPATLYAYVSRGVLRRRRGDDGRRSLFSLAEVEELARRGRPRNQPPELVIESRVTTLGVDRPYYRGIDALELARTAAFESVAEWLWTGEPARGPSLGWAGDPEGVRAAIAAQRALPDGLLPIDRLQVSTTVLGATDSLRYQLDPASVAATGRRLIAGLIDSLPFAADPPIAQGEGQGGVAGRLWARLCPAPPTPAQLAALQAALVLLADHELAASTLAARVAASAKADPYAVVLTGLGVLGGPLHGGASYDAERLLAEVTDPGRAARVIADRVRRGERIPGYGHSVYKNGDARGAFLMDLVEAAAPGHERLEAIRAVTTEVRRRRLPEPNIDFALAGLTAVSGTIPGSGEAIFAVARIAGWLAHAMEEYAKGTLLRLRATPR
ncbi:citrate/2-methylcitrate synthase [Nonomuraea sp. NPDC049152]|uniref:citrate/2-methylcitrate synthase n=1 Tax=Nonomuraea sp. NPDC049152 TaxID=3154350 RepID=UPI0033EB79A6